MRSEVRFGGSKTFSRFMFCCTFAILFVALSTPPAHAKSKPEVSPYDACVIHIQNKKYRDAMRIAMRYYKSKRPEHRWTGRALVARILRETGNLEKAKKVLSEFDRVPEEFDFRTAPCFLEIARIKIAGKDYLTALSILNVLGKNQNGIARAECAEGISDVFLKMKKFHKALDWLDYGIRYLESLESENEAMDEATQKYIAKLRVKKAYISKVLEVMDLGLGYVLYRDAERARRDRKDYPAALQKYEDLIKKEQENRGNVGLLDELLAADIFDDERLQELPVSPIYAEAGKLYRNYCMAKMRRENEAIRNLAEFIRENDSGPYRVTLVV